ncbi:YhjD/YihY/BrkB family envelope integrity protein [Polynucleobacter necessarius]|uniref:YhjD/YihY/BrkB family envelope integrity protein n=1 Tax=Polynucleobacter necessarius TaxID=576610 RepID=UPI001E43DE11|nr:YhjD/YihY/BrkB family envelope integrity protein [Polynucleobacter necessarius]
MIRRCALFVTPNYGFLWGKKIWERNRGQNLQQIAASLAFTTTYMPGGLNQQVFIYLDQFSSQAKDLTFVGSVALIITTVMTLAVIEGAFNQIFRVKTSRPLYKKILIDGAATILGPILLGIGIYTSKWSRIQRLRRVDLMWIYMTWWITLAGAVLVSTLSDIRSGVIRVIRY